MVDPVKEFGQVDVHHHACARLHVRSSGSHRIVRTPSGPEAVAVFAKARIDQGLQHLQHLQECS